MMHTVVSLASTIPDHIRLSFEIGTTDIFAVVALLAFGGLLTALSVIASDRSER
jgi:hypothetical protein